MNCVPQKAQHSPTEPERFHRWWAGAVIAGGSAEVSAEGMLLATALC